MRKFLNRLNLWKRLGVVVTVLWLGCAPLVFLQLAHSDRFELASMLAEHCWTNINQFRTSAEFEAASKCVDAVDYTYYGYSYWEYMAMCLLVASLVWLFAYAATYTARWVWAGRSVSS